MRKKQFVQNDNNMAIAYYRFSSHAQNEQSIDQQRELAEEYAEAHGLTIVKEYVDEALSGRDDTRPQYQLMLSEVKTLKPAVLILWKTDRLGRDRFDLQIARRIIRGVGCSIECVAEPFIDPNDPTSIFVEGVLDAQAELSQANKEIRNIIDAIKQGLVSKTLQQSLSELESKQEALEDAIAVEKAKLELANNDYGIKHYFEMYAKADFEDDETRRLIFEYFIDKIYVFDDKLIIDMFYSDNHVEVGLDAFLASEEYAKESIKDIGLVFDQNTAGSTLNMADSILGDLFICTGMRLRK